MSKLGILATLKARPGKEADVEQFLASAGPLVEAEVGTVDWYAFKTASDAFGIFDTFNDETGRQAHINGEVAKALFARAEDLFAEPPRIQMADILAKRVSRSLL